MILARQEGRRQGATEGERVTTPQHLTLLALADGPRSVSGVAAETGVAVSTATRMLQSLMRVEWVQPATPAAGEDRRRRPVELTPEGRRVLEQADEVMRARFRRLLEVLDEEERAAVVAGLAAFARALQADDERGPSTCLRRPPAPRRADPRSAPRPAAARRRRAACRRR